MATHTYQVTEVTSDVSGEAGASTIHYSVQDTKYAIDLTEAEAKEFFEAFAPYISVSSVKKGPGGRSRSGSTSEAAQIREWAAANGHEVNPSGRIPTAVREAYDAAHRRRRAARTVAGQHVQASPASS